MPSRRQVNWAKFRIVMVVTCALTILSVLVYLLTGGTLLEAKTTLRLFLPDATGVAQGSPVRVNGIDVGKVRSVRLTSSADPNRVVEVVMTVEVDRLRSIPLDSYAQISAYTLVGDKFVDISSGRMGKPVLPNGEIRYEPQTDIMKNLDLAQFEQKLRVVDALLTDIEQGKGTVGEFVQGDKLYSDTRASLIELEKGVTRAAQTTGRVGAALYSDDLYRRVSGAVRGLDEALARLQSGQGSGGQLLRDTGDYERVLAGVQDLRRSLAEVSANPLLSQDTLYQNLSLKVAALIRGVDRFNTNPMLTTSELYDNLDGAAREARDFMRDFRRDPKKMLWMKGF